MPSNIDGQSRRYRDNSLRSRRIDDYDRTPPSKRESRSRKRRHGEKSKKRKRSYSTISSSESCHTSPDHRHKSKSERLKEKNMNDTVLEKLVKILDRRIDTRTPSSSRSEIQGPHNTVHGSQNVISGFDPNAKSQSMKHWLAKVDESAQVFGWSEQQTIFYALPKLEGLAKKWYAGLTTIQFTWAEWREKLMNEFPGEQNYGELLAEMLARKSRRYETLEVYYYDKMTLINRCELVGKQAVDCLSHGIYDFHVRMNIQGADLKTPEEVLKYIRNISILSNSNNQLKSSTMRAVESSNQGYTKMLPEQKQMWSQSI